jgi:hypothetical protein
MSRGFPRVFPFRLIFFQALADSHWAFPHLPPLEQLYNTINLEKGQEFYLDVKHLNYNEGGGVSFR